LARKTEERHKDLTCFFGGEITETKATARKETAPGSSSGEDEFYIYVKLIAEDDCLNTNELKMIKQQP
jgi:hypothetical protein